MNNTLLEEFKSVFLFSKTTRVQRGSIFTVLAIIIFSCTSSNKKMSEAHTYTNALINETSPYLLQHAHNPVDWNPWNDATLQKAKEEKKLLLISIGYAACHWCHVMERESFEDSTVAAVMNEHFVNIKVDREERPDVDQVYINAVQLMTGSAGWPLNVIALPDGRPVWGGTYFKKEDWMGSIQQIQKIYENDPAKLTAYASKLEQGIKTIDLVERNPNQNAISAFPTEKVLGQWASNFDQEYGGYNRAPKFMMPSNWHYLLRKAIQKKDSVLLAQVELTLKKMAYGGLYDAVDGGFSRYSVDNKWHVPHFEKMLYDNGLLVSLYSDAYAATNNPLYKYVVEETLTFIAGELTDDSGAFYSSLDADSDNTEGELEEGAFYVYTKEELEDIIGEDFKIFEAYYNVNDFGKWEGNYVLIRTEDDITIADQFNISEEELTEKKSAWRKKLSDYRNEQRSKPRLDDKVLTSWNGLMLKGYVDAYKAFQNEEYLEAASTNANFIKSKQLKSSGALYHNFKDGKSTINGYLEDYATVIEAYIALYEVTMDAEWLTLSKKMADYAIENFFEDEQGMFYFTSKEDEKLVARTVEYRDNVIPASNSIMAKNLFKLSHYFDAKNYREISDQMLLNVLPEAEKYPSSFSNWLDLLEHHRFNFYEIVVSGPNASEKLKELQQNYIPNTLYAASNKPSEDYLLEGRFQKEKTLIYVCVNNACRLPVQEVSEALQTIKISE